MLLCHRRRGPTVLQYRSKPNKDPMSDQAEIFTELRPVLMKLAGRMLRSEVNCRQILRRARERITAKESTALPAREQNQRVVSEFLQAAETGELEPLLKLLSFEAALARDAGDLSKPVPPLVHDREILFQTLGNSLTQMRDGSDSFTLFPIGHDYAYVARCGITAKGAILLRVIG